MKNFDLENKSLNLGANSKPIKIADDGREHESVPTLHREVHSKNEIIITHYQMIQAKWLFEQYGLTKPGWLRTHFAINQRRRKLLNTQLYESGLDSSYCELSRHDESWADALHKLWHKVNQLPPCKHKA